MQDQYYSCLPCHERSYSGISEFGQNICPRNEAILRKSDQPPQRCDNRMVDGGLRTPDVIPLHLLNSDEAHPKRSLTTFNASEVLHVLLRYHGCLPMIHIRHVTGCALRLFIGSGLLRYCYSASEPSASFLFKELLDGPPRTEKGCRRSLLVSLFIVPCCRSDGHSARMTRATETF